MKKNDTDRESESSALLQGNTKRMTSEAMALPAFIVVGLAFISFLNCGLHGEPVIDAARFFAFQVFCIIIPGCALASLIKVPRCSQVLFASLAYALGYCLAIALYIVSAPLGVFEFVPLAYALIVPVSALVMLHRRDYLVALTVTTKDTVIVAVFIVLLTGIYFFVFSGSNYLPTEASGNSYYCDNLFWIGNTIELKMEYPPVEFRTLADNFRYHMFSSMQLAVIAESTNIPVANLVFHYSYIQNAILMGLGFFASYSLLVKRKILCVFACLMFFLTSGDEKLMLITWMHHLYIGQIDTGISLTFGMLFVSMCTKLFEDKDYRKPSIMIVLAVFAFAAFGTKATAASLLLVFLFVLCFMGLFRKGTRALSLGLGFGILFAVIVCFALFVGDFSVAGDTLQGFSGEKGVSFFINTMTPRLNNYFNFFVGLPIPHFLAEALYVLFYAFCGQPVVMTLFFTGLFLKAFRWRTISSFDVGAVAMVVVGLILLRMVSQSGLSQTQFFTGTYPFAILFGMRAISDALSATSMGFRSMGLHGRQDSSRGAFVEKATYVILIAILVVGTACNVKYNWNQYLQYHFMKGARYYVYGNEREVPVILKEEGIKNSFTTSGDYELYTWVRDNTDPKALVVVDKTTMYSKYVYEPGAFMERHVYNPNAENDYTHMPDTDEIIEKDAMIVDAFSGDGEAISMLRELGVDYMVSTSGESNSALDDKALKVYENESGAVYRIS